MKIALPLLLAPALAAAPAPRAAKPDRGTVTLGSEVYRFKPETLSASQPGPTQPMMLFLRGQLVPVKGGKALSFSFQLFRPGPLGGMTLSPRVGKGPQWIATIKTKVDASFPQPPKEGQEAVFTFSGPLIRTEGSASAETSWQGQIRASFTSVP